MRCNPTENFPCDYFVQEEIIEAIDETVIKEEFDDTNVETGSRKIIIVNRQDIIPYKVHPRKSELTFYILPVNDSEKVPEMNAESSAAVKSTKEKNDGKKYACSTCNEAQESRSALIRHKRTHKNQPTTCDMCGEKFLIRSALKKHLFKIHEKIEEGVVCEICGKSCPDSRLLNRHKKRHSNEKPFSCHICGKCFKNKRFLKRHIEGVHLKSEQSYNCEKCGKTFNKKDTYGNHLKTHMECKFECKMCKRLFASDYGLQIHVASVHVNFIPDKCKQCGEQSCEHLKPRLKPQYVPRKFKEKNKSCPNCGKLFVYDSEVKYHIQVHHSDERKYVCEECGKSFKTLNSFKLHERVHLDQRPYACKFCDKKFRTLNHIKQHTRTHTGEKPYVCPICERGFAQIGDMKKHVLKVHGVKYDEVKNKNCKND